MDTSDVNLQKKGCTISWQKEFHYPIYYIILGWISFIFPLVVAGLMIWAGLSLWPILGALAIASLGFLLTYSATKKIIIDNNGIAECNLFREKLRICWKEISEVKTSGWPTNQITIYRRGGKAIEISQALVGYSLIVDLLYQMMEVQSKLTAETVSEQGENLLIRFHFEGLRQPVHVLANEVAFQLGRPVNLINPTPTLVIYLPGKRTLKINNWDFTPEEMYRQLLAWKKRYCSKEDDGDTVE